MMGRGWRGEIPVCAGLNEHARWALAAAFLALAGVQCGSGDVDDADLSSTGHAAARSVDHAQPELVLQSPEPDAVDVPLTALISVGFREPVDPTLLGDGALQVMRVDHGGSETLPGYLTYSDRVLSFHPVARFVYNTQAGSTSTSGQRWLGFRQDSRYDVVLRIGNNRNAQDAIRWSFSTRDHDYGIYWLGPDGEAAKAAPGRATQFFDPSKPTVLFLHGWEVGSCRNDYARENPFFFNLKYGQKANAARSWIDLGFNVGVFFWEQWADEPDVSDVESKIWCATCGDKRMRYALRSGEYAEDAAGKSVRQVLYDAYVATFMGYHGPGIRLIGHSSGAQLAIAVAHMLSEAVQRGVLESFYVPSRLVLLDPYWGKRTVGPADGKSVGQLCADYVRDLSKRHDVVVEQYKSSEQGGLIAGDENLRIRGTSAFARLWPSFIPITDFQQRHIYSYVWYMTSIDAKVYGDFSPMGAAASDAEVRSHMNAGQASPSMWYTDGPGTKTWTARDDCFYRKAGVSTW